MEIITYTQNDFVFVLHIIKFFIAVSASTLVLYSRDTLEVVFD